MKFLFVLLLVPFLIIPAYGESQTLPTEKGILDVRLTHDPIEPDVQSKINIDFINPQTQKIQEHIDYTIAIFKDEKVVFGPIPLRHTSTGTLKIPIEFNLGNGVYSMDLGVEGILFQPISTETVSFDISVGQANDTNGPVDPIQSDDCLIATAAYGTELAPQVQFLREIRDNTLMSTVSGASFMTGFNAAYYSFAPTVAQWERDNPTFQKVVKAFITPMISTLSIMALAEEGSEAEVIGLGISVIALNLGMYVGIPAFGILKLYQFRKN